MNSGMTKQHSDFYEVKYQEYFDSTYSIDPSTFLSMVVNRLAKGSRIFDIGCGSGRDLLWLKMRGYEATGLERSLGLAELARFHSGCPVFVGDFTVYEFSSFQFDALLLIGSLVHLSHAEFPSVLLHISQAIKQDGLIFLTVKEGGEVSRNEDGRLFSLWQSYQIEAVLRKHEFSVMDFSRTISAVNAKDVWLSYLLRRKECRSNG
jgi:SAM-dependent methyltransferase